MDSDTEDSPGCLVGLGLENTSKLRELSGSILQQFCGMTWGVSGSQSCCSCEMKCFRLAAHKRSKLLTAAEADRVMIC